MISKNAVAVVVMLGVLAACSTTPEEQPQPPTGTPDEPSVTCIDEGNACPINLGEDVAGVIPAGEYASYYTVTLSQDGVLEYGLMDYPSDEELRLLLHAEQGAIPIVSQDSGEAVVSAQVLKAGTYLLEVGAGYSNVESPAAFTLTTALNTDDQYEFNQTQTDAKAIALNTEVGGYIYGLYKGYTEEDVFRFEVSAPQTVTVTIEGVPTLMQPDLEVVNATRTFREATPINLEVGAGAELEVELPEAGTYYLTVSDGGGFGPSGLGDKTQAYTINITTP